MPSSETLARGINMICYYDFGHGILSQSPNFSQHTRITTVHIPSIALWWWLWILTTFKRDHASEALLKAPVSHPTPPHHSTSALPVKKRAAAVTSTTDNSRDSRKGQLPFNSCCKHAVVRRPFMHEVCKLKHLSKGHLPLMSCKTAQKSRTFWSRSNTVEISCADLQAWLDTIFTRGLDRKLCVRWTKVWILYSTQQAARTQKAG